MTLAALDSSRRCCISRSRSYRSDRTGRRFVSRPVRIARQLECEAMRSAPRADRLELWSAVPWLARCYHSRAAGCRREVNVLPDTRQRLGFTARSGDSPQSGKSCTIRRINNGAAVCSPGQSVNYLAIGRQTPRLTPGDRLKVNVIEYRVRPAGEGQSLTIR